MSEETIMAKTQGKAKTKAAGKPKTKAAARGKKPEVVVIKIGGRMANNAALLEDFAHELAALGRGRRFVVVHGGGKEVSELSEKLLGKPAVFINGVRQTSPEEMEIVEMVLSGKVNKRLVRLFQANNIKVVGLSGADGPIFQGEVLSSDPPTRTGRVAFARRALIQLLFNDGYVPVVSSTTMDAHGEGVNINADEAALELAKALKAHILLFLSDIPGVLKDGAPIATLSTWYAKEEIENGVITGGMIPKVKSALAALDCGVKKIIIGEYDAPGALARLLEGTQGTSIVK
jgi:acetylglutamate kinase